MNEEEIKPSASNQLVAFFKSVFSVDKINYALSIENIKSDVEFKGFNIWILICSILICSLGLNMNSTAVIIGAMLISPLMGPIVGLGLGIGIYDRKLIFKALRSLGIAGFISIVTAVIFFKITPTAAVPEILARTEPTLLDLFVAFFGGIAGILAASRCLSTNVVPGVAIATALMPPLCTAGFGLAIGNWDYFAGALYLFFMNTIMISLAALIVVIYLRYPKFSFVNDRTKNRVKSAILAVVLGISVPSIYFYSNLLQKNLQNDRIESFVQNELESMPGIFITNKSVIPTDSGFLLRLNINGTFLEKGDIERLDSQLLKYSLQSAKLQIIQAQPLGFKEQRLARLKTDIIQELYHNSAESIQNKDQEIAFLQAEVQKLSRTNYMSENVMKLAKTQYDIETLGVDVMVYSDGTKLDTIPTALVGWKKGISSKEKLAQGNKLNELLKIQLGVEEVILVEIK